MRRATLRHLVPALGLLVAAACGDGSGADSDVGVDAPIVLAHGFAGFDRIAGIMDYWYGIPEALEADGARVFVTEVSPANSSVVRGEQLIEQLEPIAAASAAGRVHLIGHSQGGIDARYVMGLRPELLASVTTIGSPHRLPEEFQVDTGPVAEAIAATLLGALGGLISALSTNDRPNDPAGAASFFDGEAYDAFNARFPAGLPEEPCGEGAPRHGDIRLYSWTGTTLRTTALDPLDLVFAATGSLLDEPNDGLVERCAAHFGRVLRDDYGWNHLDEVNLMFGLVPENEVHPIAVLREHVAMLRGIDPPQSGLATDASGRLAPGPATLALFRGLRARHADGDEARAALAARVERRLPGPAARDAMRLFDRFLALGDVESLVAPEAWQPAAFEARLDERSALRAHVLGREAAAALFAAEEAAQREAIARYGRRLQRLAAAPMPG